MDALILSCGTGGGHDAAGKAVLEEMKRRGHNVTMLNPYTLKSKKLSGGIDKTYISTVQHAPGAFGAVYKIGDLYRKLPFRSPVYFVNRGMMDVMQEYFSENHVDIVIMPHLFPAEIMTNMKKHGMEIPKTMFIATDYVCIPFTEETDCDAYVIPAPDLTSEFTGKGIPDDKIYPLGIPTSGSFLSQRTKEEEKQLLELDINKKYILIAGGSMGGGKIEKTIEELKSFISEQNDVAMIVISGSNHKLYEKLTEQAIPDMIVLEKTDKMASYMRASDLFITKPGGLSSTEAAVCHIPILHTSTIPGCESCNADYFSRHGMSIACNAHSEFLSIVEDILNNREKAEAMTDCQEKCINRHAATDICELAEKLVRLY
ncbi:MAG: glycosyltransferase [Lachnospira sp.]